MKIALALCLAATLAISQRALAQAGAGAPLVVLVSKHNDHPLVVRLHDELAALGLALRSAPPPTEKSELLQLARRYSAAAVVQVDDLATQIMILVPPNRTEGSRGEFVIAEAPGAAAEPRLLALRAVEVLRGLLLPIEERARSEPADGSDGPPASASAVAAHRSSEDRGRDREQRSNGGDTTIERPVSLLLAPALAWSPGGVDPTFGIRLAAEYRFFAWLGLESSALLPAGPAQAEAVGGALDVRVLSLGLALRASTELAEQLSVGGGVGQAVLWTRWERTTSAPTPDLQNEAWTALPYVEAGGTLWLHSVVGIRADALAGWSTSAVELKAEPSAPVTIPVSVADRTRSTFGRPLLLLSLGFEVRL